MPQSKQPENASPPASSLPERADGYKKEVEKVVREVGEHPLYELKRSCSLQNLAEKMEFVKDFQSIATSRIQAEKFLVIGADDSSRCFRTVQNLHEFDEAAIRQLLGKYLSPVPDFELFQMKSSDGHAFVLFVIPKQKQRRILAKVTVEDAKDLKPRVLLREGDLWTKGSSTGKRLAKSEDWDEIYDEVIEAEAEQRTKRRTAHALELATAREKLKPSYGLSALPSFFTDEEFQAIMEDLCSSKDSAKFNVLLERLRDDVVEGWHQVDAHEEPHEILANPPSIPQLQEKARDHIKNVFRPAMHWLTLAGMYTVKNTGPTAFLDAVTDLLKEVFETSHQLQMPGVIVASRGATVRSIEEHFSHTVPALESLISLHLIGAYLAKRSRFQYLRSLFRPDVHRTGWQRGQQAKKQPMAFWPLDVGHGEPDELRFCAGRIDHCANRVKTDSAYLKLFGSATVATASLCQYEFCLELNSFVAMRSDLSPETAAYLAQLNPDIRFDFWPSLIAFPLESIQDLGLMLFSEVRQAKPRLLKLTFFDDALASFMIKPGADVIFGNFLSGLVSDQAKLYIDQHRWPPMFSWPQEVKDVVNRLQNKKQEPRNA